MRSAIYFCVMPFSALYIRCSILYVIRCLTGSKCSLRRTGVIYSEFRVLVTSRAAQFCIYCSLSIKKVCLPGQFKNSPFGWQYSKDIDIYLLLEPVQSL